jgi:integrase
VAISIGIPHGIRLRKTSGKPKRQFYSPAQIQKLLPELLEPCRTVVKAAVLTGLRIGEILALKWKRIDLLHGTLEVAETYSDGFFGSPKTRSSARVIPMCKELTKLFMQSRSESLLTGPDDLVFATSKGTPLNWFSSWTKIRAR